MVTPYVDASAPAQRDTRPMISKANTGARGDGPRLPRRPIVRRLSRETGDEQADWSTVPDLTRYF